MEDDRDLELAPQAVQQVTVEDVPDAGRRGAPRDRLVHGPDVEGQHVVDREIRELMDEAVPDLAPRAGHQDHRPACHHGSPGPDG